jgi:hypothetical protein
MMRRVTRPSPTITGQPLRVSVLGLLLVNGFLQPSQDRSRAVSMIVLPV